MAGTEQPPSPGDFNGLVGGNRFVSSSFVARAAEKLTKVKNVCYHDIKGRLQLSLSPVHVDKLPDTSEDNGASEFGMAVSA